MWISSRDIDKRRNRKWKYPKFPRPERPHTGYPHTKNEVSSSSGSKVMTMSLKTGNGNKMEIFINSVADTPPTNQI